MFEHRAKPVIGPQDFLRRMGFWLAVTVALFGLSLFAGMAGFRWLEGASWTDAFLNAAMLLGGMGPVSAPASEGGKLFAGIYAMYCGVFLIVCSGLLLLPVFHRLLHRFHADSDDF